MATKKTPVQNITKNSVVLLNGIRDKADKQYKATVPVATESNLKYVGQAIFDIPNNKNQFLDLLINRIGLVYAKNLYYTNPLKIFKKGTLMMGDTIQEIFVDLAKSFSYEWESGDDSNVDPFKRVIPEVKAAYHYINWLETYQQTTTEPELTLAFTNADGVVGIVEKIVGSMYAASEVDEWVNFKKLMNEVYKAGHIAKVQLDSDPVDRDSVEDMTVKARALATKLTMPSRKYNIAGVMQTTNLDKLVLIIKADTEALMDVKSLARAFNMSEADFLGRVVVIDEFDKEMEDAGVKALMVDEDWFQVYDKLYRTDNIYNPKKMYFNYFLHVWMVYSASPFENAVALQVESFTEPDSITVTTPPTKVTYTAGDDFDATGLVVTATYKDGSTGIVENSKLTFSPSTGLATTDTAVTISYTVGETTVTTTQAITVTE